jgi:hypothetical protein
MAELSRLAYTGPEELLAEKFHVTEELLKALNPNKPLDEAGTKIVVPNVLDEPKRDRAAKAETRGLVERIEVDKARARAQGLRKGRQARGVLPRLDWQRRQACAQRGASGAGHRREPGLHLQSGLQIQGGQGGQEADHQPGPNNPSARFGSISPSRASASTGRRSPAGSASPTPMGACG